MVEQPAPGVFVSGDRNIAGQHLSNVGNTTTYNIRDGADQDPLRDLRERVVPEAMHDSKDVVDQGTCHPGTRIAVLEDVTAWIERLDPGSTLKWLRGAAGAGKSAIARTFANQLAGKGLLLASFFCLRSNDRRSNASLVIPTLVEQIITRIPSLVPVAEAAFRADIRILTKSVEIQASRLIVEPLASIEPELRRSLPRVIVIDGLDEIKGAQAQCDILKAIAFLIDNLPFPIHFLVASRPEHQIQHYFAQSMGNRWSIISLDNTYHPNRDIIIFYKAHFSLIVAAFPAFNFEPDWPGDVARRVLVAKGSGQFIFADTVIRFVGNTSIAISPQKRLDLILKNVSNDKLKPMELLDLIYVTVFEAVPKEELQDVLNLVGLVLLPLDFIKAPQLLDTVLCLEPGTTTNRLRYLHSVLKVPSSPNEAIAPLHATLGDFVFNRDRSLSFGLHLDQERFHQDVALGILKGSMVQPASDQLNDYRADWFGHLYWDPIRTFAKDSIFRTALASHIREVQGSDITLWPPLALATTYRIALKALTSHSSWLEVKDYFSWWSLEKKRRKEVLRRFRTYATMGLTGQIFVFMQLISATVEFHRSNGILRVLKALPDQDVVAIQRLAGLALPFTDLIEDHPGTKKDLPMFAETFVDPAFLETFFILSSQSDLDRGFGPLDIFLAFSKASFFARRRDKYILQLLSLRKLPQNKPSWSDDAKLLFDGLLGKLFVQEAERKAKTNSGPKFEAAKKALLERVAALERSRRV